MKNTIAIIIRRLSLGSLALLILTAATFAVPVVRKVSGATPAAINLGVDIFKQDLGGANNGVGGSYAGGRREIDWEDAPTNYSYALPVNYYNSNSPRGVVLSSACTQDSFRTSSPSTLPRFDDLLDPGDTEYSSSFKTFSGQRLFAAHNLTTNKCNITDVYFYIPGTNTPATVSGFGVVFTDVDVAASTRIFYYDAGGSLLAPLQNPVAANNGLSFLGVSFNAGERIARVRIVSGNVILEQSDGGGTGFDDVVVMDDFIYGEPRAIGQHSADFDGDGVSDYSVFRPSNGTWYVMNSGSNTFNGTQFGASGDVPVDGDFDGDSRNDLAVFRPSNGAWYILRSSSGQFQGTTFGQTGDKPVAGDYDKDGKSDIAVWRPSNGTYYYLKSSNGQFSASAFGTSGDIPIGSSLQ